MKKISIIAATVFSICFVFACTKEHDNIIDNTPSATNGGANSGQYGIYGRSNARFSGPDYSQSMPVDTANRMLSSYLTSVGYPGVDTALRSLSFDADTLRAYLQNPNIVTLKFMLAHKQSYINGGFGNVTQGLNPQALTLIVVGLNENDQYVLNGFGGVYDHLNNCPAVCDGNSSALIQ